MFGIAEKDQTSKVARLRILRHRVLFCAVINHLLEEIK